MVGRRILKSREMDAKGHQITLRDEPRHVEIVVDGVTLASSTRTVVLEETGLPPRHYFPRDDVRVDLAAPTDTSTHCPFKGQASYLTFTSNGHEHGDLAWSYETPIAGMERIGGLVCFFDERVHLTVDGEKRDRPRTQWSEAD
jgi:uncharacterized protein (DUF427 family)